MTCIIAWKNIETKNPSIWIVGDTKISTNKTAITNEGCKILDIDLKVKDISTPNQPIYYKSTLGFAFAGSSLVAYSVFFAAKYFLGNVGGLKKQNQLPTLESIALKIENILGFYTKSIQSKCEIFLTGKCPVKNKLEIYKIELEMKNGILVAITNRLGMDETAFYFLGDKQAEMEKEVLEMTNYLYEKKDKKHTRAPLYALQKVIKENKFSTIGGNLQLGILYALPYGTFGLVSIFDNNSDNKATYYYNNIDLVAEIGDDLDGCRLGISGLYIEPIK